MNDLAPIPTAFTIEYKTAELPRERFKDGQSDPLPLVLYRRVNSVPNATWSSINSGSTARTALRFRDIAEAGTAARKAIQADLQAASRLGLALTGATTIPGLEGYWFATVRLGGAS